MATRRKSLLVWNDLLELLPPDNNEPEAQVYSLQGEIA